MAAEAGCTPVAPCSEGGARREAGRSAGVGQEGGRAHAGREGGRGTSAEKVRQFKEGRKVRLKWKMREKTGNETHDETRLVALDFLKVRVRTRFVLRF